MSSPADDDMIREFVVEADEMLNQAETDLLSLDKGGDFKSRFDSIFRVFHSLKGGAGMLGLSALQAHMHALENTLSTLKSASTLTSEESHYFLQGIDAGRQILAGQAISFDYNTHGTSSGDVSESKASEATAPVPKTTSGPARTEKSSAPMAYIVDDEPDILESLCQILANVGIEQRAFLSPVEALAEILKNPPDVVLTDMKMPQMSGLTLLNKIREQHADIPVILISGNITTDSLLEAINEGIFGAIEKPFKTEVILTYTLAAIKQHRTFKMFRRGLNLLLYQFSDLEDFLKANGKEDAARTARTELTTLLAQWKELSSNHAAVRSNSEETN